MEVMNYPIMVTETMEHLDSVSLCSSGKVVELVDENMTTEEYLE